ncbi:hypothetical protein [uncultured Clostridium sp.]|uniref:hypothetical protein n=1 Tax=uncultured Clostridium sp. TaxID=59620 RepID=UPI00263A110A|nr:hypothetical protein [uncultured Clostridium sp.]
MNMSTVGIILILIIYKGFVSAKAGKTKKVKEGIFILPFVFLYLAVEQMKSVNIGVGTISFIAICIVIGAAVGLFRSRFYKVLVNENGEIVYKREVWDILILVVYLVIKIALDFSIGYFDKNLVNSVEAGALFMACASIAVRKLKIYVEANKLKGIA